MKKGIGIAGTIAVDEIKRINNFPKESELSPIKSVKRSIGGAVCNCSVGLTKIDRNLPIDIVALIGDDDKGDFLYDRLKEYKNLNLDQLKKVGSTPFTDVMQNAKDKTRTFFAYKGNATFFDESTIDFSKLNVSILHIAYILMLDTLDGEDPEYGTKMAKVLKRAQDKGIETSIDIVSENSNRYEEIVTPSLKFTNYCIVNEIEAGKSVGIELRDPKGRLIVENIASVLKRLKILGVNNWAIIHTPEGSFGYDGIKLESVPSLQIDKSKIKGTVGAGDAYLSGALYGAYKGLKMIEAMKLGTASAAMSLLEEDSTSGIKPYEELMMVYQTYAKKEFISI